MLKLAFVLPFLPFPEKRHPYVYVFVMFINKSIINSLKHQFIAELCMHFGVLFCVTTMFFFLMHTENNFSKIISFLLWFMCDQSKLR